MAASKNPRVWANVVDGEDEESNREGFKGNSKTIRTAKRFRRESNFYRRICESLNVCSCGDRRRGE
jgi:hypothetical protein